MKFEKITALQIKVLEHLHEYRFLTADQLHRIGTAKNIQTLHKTLKILREQEKPLVSCVDFGIVPSVGRLANIHYLTQHGAKLLAEALQTDPDEIKHPKGVKLFTHDYFHRLATVDFHILARLFCDAHAGVELDYFQAYFEHRGANHWGDPNQPKREALNKIKIDDKTAFIPDCILHITDPNGTPFLFTGEIYRGHSTKRVHQQLYKYLLAIKKGSINIIYNYMRGIPLLVLCEQERAMLALMQRLAQDPNFKHTEHYFLFRTLEPVPKEQTPITILQEAFAKGWKTYTGKERGLFR